ncbi:MAG: NAD-dependent epimerase/dehydratase family protein [Alphaproteobacteria bacterium]|nr:NAD-dependent epimerase/dehydratase family protein [Alphaproteobacteria bacterium]
MVHLVTGGSGFVGAAIARALLADGAHVRVFDLWRAPDLPQGVSFVQGDVTDAAAVGAAMQDVTHVHHNAALVPLSRDRRRVWHVNVEGTRTVLEAARRTNVRRFVHMSSSTVFGVPENVPVTGASPRVPFEAYGRAKKAGEDLVLAAMESGFPAAVIRPRTVIGPGRLGIFAILFSWIRAGANIPVFGSGDNLFQFVHVDDIAQAGLLCCARKARGAFNIGAENFGTLRGDLEFLCRYAGTGSRVISLPSGPAIAALRLLDIMRLSPLAPWHYRTYHKPFYFDMEPARSMLGFRARHDNRTLLTEGYDWYCRHGDGEAGHDASLHKRPVRQGMLHFVRFLLRMGGKAS